MTRKDYERAASIVRDAYGNASNKVVRAAGLRQAEAMEEAFVSFFAGDNVKFDEDRFRSACQPRN